MVSPTRKQYMVAFSIVIALVLFAVPSIGDHRRVRRQGGQSIANLSAAWWQWAVALPDEDHPVTSEGEVDCSLGQMGSVWFLAGTTGGAAERSCTVPQGTALFYPLVNVAFVNEPGDCDRPTGCTVQEKRDILDFAFTVFPCNLFSIMDGVPTVQSSIVTARTQSRPFSVKVKNSVLFTEGAKDRSAVSDGFWVRLPRLSMGQHDVEFGGAFCDPETNEVFFEVDVIYHLNVVDDNDSN